ncbi:MAG: 2-amino-4-hydroxy-6-hydroxymethyldihydropteridine diphosphokinase [Sarcina sp.]
MDKIVIKDFEVFANHGVFQEEKTLGQKFVLDMELSLSTREAAKTGDLTKSVHYGELAHKIEKLMQEKSYDLIETVAENIAEFILLEYDMVNSVKVRVKKPWAPIHRTLDTVYVEIERGWHSAYLSFGSNLGDRNKNIEDALNYIDSSKENKVVKVSSIIETEPWGYEEQDNFLNGACEIKTLLTPKELIRFLLEIEGKLKRERVIKWGPRTLDLDVLYYDDLISEDEEIIIPHPRMELREFVLKPLDEIASNKLHPIKKLRTFEMLAALK